MEVTEGICSKLEHWLAWSMQAWEEFLPKVLQRFFLSGGSEDQCLVGSLPDIIFARCGYKGSKKQSV
jgi:hypothetical protein